MKTGFNVSEWQGFKVAKVSETVHETLKLETLKLRFELSSSERKL